MNCPICKKEVAADNPEMPFCSRRCRVLDLGNWAAEKYVIPGEAKPENRAEDSGDNGE